jgi:hypothetical protein
VRQPLEVVEVARFYGSIQGNRGEATRMGSASSGITAHPRGWSIGVKVDGYPSMGDTERDEFAIRCTSGSGDYGASIPIATVREVAGGKGWRMVRLFDPEGRILAEYVVNREGSIIGHDSEVPA